MNGSISPAHELEFGVYLKAQCYRSTTLLYLHPTYMGDVIRKHGIKYHFCDDDTQIYLTPPPPLPAYAVSKLEKCITEVRS